MAAAAWIGHMNWRTDPSATPGTRNSGMEQARVGIDTVLRYEDRWDLLGGPTDDVAVLLPGSLRERAQLDRVGLPPGHPWATRLPEW